MGPKTLAAIEHSQLAGVPVVVATGRMFRSVLPYLTTARIDEPVVCYQGAAVVRPTTAEWLLHARIDVALALEAIEALEEAGYSPNVYVDDELFVARHTAYSRAYADFQRLPVTEVGELASWLTNPPTKLVAVGDPLVLPTLRDELRERFDERLFVTTSLPTLLEIGHHGVSKGTGLQVVAAELGIDRADVVAFGDGENDVELLQEAGFGIAIEGGHERLRSVADATCPGPDREGVASVIDAYLDSLA